VILPMSSVPALASSSASARARPSFQTPKVYDPSLADRPLPLLAREDAKLQQLRDLGFDDADTGGASPWQGPGGSVNSTAAEQRLRELSEQTQQLRAQVSELQEALVEAKNSDARTTQKLQSVTQVNRSQTALMRAELQKSRRRLAHAQAVSARLRAQAQFFQGHAGPQAQALPTELCGLPTEDEAVEETGELAQLHARWERDILQLQAEVASSSDSGEAACASEPLLSNGKEAGKASELEVAQQRISELESSKKTQKKEVERLGKEVEQLRIAVSSASEGAPRATEDGSSAAASSSAALASMAAQHEESVSKMQQDIQAAQRDSKDQVKKLKQLATAYKQLEKTNGETKAENVSVTSELEAARAELAKPKEPARLMLSASSVAGVRRLLESQRKDVADLKASVAADLQRRLPEVMQQLLTSQVPRLQEMVAEAEKAWRDKYMEESEKRRKLHNLVQELKGNIRVYCRIRPLNARERSSCVSFPHPDEVLIHNEPMATKKKFQFNEVFAERSTQAMVFEAMRELITSMLDGFNICIFAYGQTGSGKTFSMQGTREDPGIYRRTLNELFKVAAERVSWQVSLSAAIMEIYNDEINDLLLEPDCERRKKLQVRQGKEGICVPDLTVKEVASADEVEDLLELGQRNRSVAKTDMNEHSSRSHLLVQIYARLTTPQGKELSAVMTLVDLAGSERLSRSGATGDRAKEAAHINKSLAALGDVIHARATKNNHIPYRNTTLTHLLQDSLGGDSKTLMLLQVSPAEDSVEESMCSLQFGQRVNSVEMSAPKK